MLFIFDEPSTGLHFHDIQKLLAAFDRLIERGHSIIVIEHHHDIIKVADWLIDMGPEGGRLGGNVVFAGTPEELVKCQESYTPPNTSNYPKYKQNQKTPKPKQTRKRPQMGLWGSVACHAVGAVPSISAPGIHRCRPPCGPLDAHSGQHPGRAGCGHGTAGHPQAHPRLRQTDSLEAKLTGYAAHIRTSTSRPWPSSSSVQ